MKRSQHSSLGKLCPIFKIYGYKKLAITLFIVPLFILNSCNSDRIAEQNVLISQVTDSLANINDKRNMDSLAIDSLSRIREQAYQMNSNLRDSTEQVSYDYPMSASYIYYFDKQPIDIFWDYVQQQTDEERDKLLKAQTIVAAWYLFFGVKDTVDFVRKKYLEYDLKRKACLDMVSACDEKIKSLRLEMEAILPERERLNRRLDTLNVGLAKLKESWL